MGFTKGTLIPAPSKSLIAASLSLSLIQEESGMPARLAAVSKPDFSSSDSRSSKLLSFVILFVLHIEIQKARNFLTVYLYDIQYGL